MLKNVGMAVGAIASLLGLVLVGVYGYVMVTGKSVTALGVKIAKKGTISVDPV